MRREITQDENIYKDGQRINTQTIITYYNKSDDIVQLGQDYQTVGRLEASLEQMTERFNTEKDVNVRLGLKNEITRLTTDREIMREKVKLQQGYIDSYDEAADGEDNAAVI